MSFCMREIFFNFKYIPLKYPRLDKSKIKNARLHSDTIKYFSLIYFLFLLLLKFTKQRIWYNAQVYVIFH